MSDQNLEAKLITLEALIREREAFFSSSIQKHKTFGQVKAIYMKTKLLKISYATLLKKHNQEKKNDFTAFRENLKEENQTQAIADVQLSAIVSPLTKTKVTKNI